MKNAIDCKNEPQKGKKRFILAPGIVFSARDGDKQYIGAITLAKLYGVDITECIVFDPKKGIRIWEQNYLILSPRTDGRYKEHLEGLLAVKNGPSEGQKLFEKRENMGTRNLFRRRNTCKASA